MQFAPAFRLSPHESALLVEGVFGIVLFAILLLAIFLVWRARRQVSALRVEAARGVKAGVVIVSGVAEPADEEVHAPDDVVPPFVELTIHYRGTQRRGKTGSFIVWRERSRTLRSRPFIVRTDSGMRIRVEPDDHIQLIDELELPQRSGTVRTRLAHVEEGERVWLRGELTGASGSAGPYRSSGSADVTLHPPRHEPLLVCTQRIDAEDEDDARFHGAFAAALCVSLAVCQLVLFLPYSLLAHGVPGTAQVTGKRTWLSTSGHSHTMHYGFALQWTVAQTTYDDEQEVSYVAFASTRVSDEVPIVYARAAPSISEVGTPDELGTTENRVSIAFILTSVVLLAWMISAFNRRPWWRKHALEETEPGLL